MILPEEWSVLDSNKTRLIHTHTILQKTLQKNTTKKEWRLHLKKCFHPRQFTDRRTAVTVTFLNKIEHMGRTGV